MNENTAQPGAAGAQPVGHESYGLAQDGTPAKVMDTGAEGNLNTGNAPAPGTLPSVAHPLAAKTPEADIEKGEAGEFDKVRDKLSEMWRELESKNGAGIATLKSKLLELDDFLATHLHLKYGRQAPPPRPQA
jgi:hypothetical protein